MRSLATSLALLLLGPAATTQKADLPALGPTATTDGPAAEGPTATLTPIAPPRGTEASPVSTKLDLLGDGGGNEDGPSPPGTGPPLPADTEGPASDLTGPAKMAGGQVMAPAPPSAALAPLPPLPLLTPFTDLALMRGMDALAAGDAAGALALLTPLGGEPPPLGLRARFLAAQAAARSGQGLAALAALQELEVQLPEVADFVLAQRGRVLRDLQRWAPARETWNQLLRRYPRSPFRAEATYGVGDAAFALGLDDVAAIAYRSALGTAARHERAASARLNQGILAERRGQPGQAAELYQQSLRSPGVTPELLAQARQRLARLGHLGRGAKETIPSILAQVDGLLAARSLPEAEAALATAAASGRVPADALDQRRAVLAARANDLPRAAALYGQLVARTSGHSRWEFQRALASVHATAGQYDAAIALCLAAAREQGSHREAREAQLRAAWLAYEGGQHDLAIDLLEIYLKLYPGQRDNDEVRWSLAWNAYHAGQLPRAQVALQRLRQRHPTSPLTERSLYWEGRVAVQLGQVDAARAAYGHLIGHATSYYGLWAQRRLAELADELAPRALTPHGGPYLATLTPPPAAEVPLPATEPAANLSETLLPESEDGLSWGSRGLTWNGPEGRRVLTLMQLGMGRDAARAAALLPVATGAEATTAAYARARLLYGLGDFGGAYRLASAQFQPELTQAPSPQTRHLFRLAYPDAHANLVQAAARAYAVSPLLVLAIMRQESAFDEQARSWASARGLMQLIPATGRRIAQALQEDDYTDARLPEPARNVRYGAWYLGQLVEKFEGNLVLAIASYNAGPRAVQRWVDARAGAETDVFVEDIPFRETRHYVKSVLANLAVYARLYAKSRVSLPSTIDAEYLDNVSF